MMTETDSDKLARVRMMARGDSETCDLSPNDVAALRHVLVLVDGAQARESAAVAAALQKHQNEPDPNDPDGWIRRSALNEWAERAERAESAVAAAVERERERCARICEDAAQAYDASAIETAEQGERHASDASRLSAYAHVARDLADSICTRPAPADAPGSVDVMALAAQADAAEVDLREFEEREDPLVERVAAILCFAFHRGLHDNSERFPPWKVISDEWVNEASSGTKDEWRYEARAALGRFVGSPAPAAAEGASDACPNCGGTKWIETMPPRCAGCGYIPCGYPAPRKETSDGDDDRNL